MKFTLAILSLAGSAFAYSVITPSAGTVWSSDGPNKFTWQRVETDSNNFTLILTNQNREVMQDDNQVLSALVDGTLNELSVNAPSTGFPIGNGFRLNLVKSTEQLTTIYAQSGEFSIAKPNVTSSSGSVSRTIASVPATSPATTGGSSAAGTAGSASDSASVPANSQTTGGNGALTTTVQGGVVGAIVLGAASFLL